MKLAIAEAAKSRSEDERVHPRVGVVVVKDGRVLASAHRGEAEPGEHGEFAALERKLENDSLVGATVYTTLEPCTTRNHPKVPCAHRLAERRVRRVVVGMLDPNENICGRGLWHLRDSNIEIAVFPSELMAEIEELNREFIRSHRPHRGQIVKLNDTKSSTALVKSEPEDEFTILFNGWFSAMEKGDFELGKSNHEKLIEIVGETPLKHKFVLLHLQLRAIYARDVEAFAQLEQTAIDAEMGEFAAGLHAEASIKVGDVDQAVGVIEKASKATANIDSKARLALKAAHILNSTGQPELARATLQSVLAMPLAPKIRSKVLSALTSTPNSQFSSFVKAALLARAASLDATAATLFSSAYALCEAGLHGLSALQYDFLLKISPSNSSGFNNFAVAMERMGLSGMAVSYYKRAADAGETLSMANLSQSLMKVGFLDEADAFIRKARMAEEPHENVGTAMVTLAKSRQKETEKWNEIRQISHRHLRFMHAFADAFAVSANPSMFSGAWKVGNSTQTTFTVLDMNAEATWSEGYQRRRICVEIVGSALVGTIDNWNSLLEKYEVAGQVAMVLRDDRVLWGLIINLQGEPLPIEWAKLI